MYLTKKACIYNLKGSCTKGADCPFSHDVDAARPICSFHMSGLCRNGDKCLYSHDVEGSVTPTLSRQDEQEESVSACSNGQPNELQTEADAAEWARICMCKECHQQFAVPADLLYHIREKHPECPQAAELEESCRCCPACHRVLKTFLGLSDHIRSKHLIPLEESWDQQQQYGCEFG
jgi:hypothetical protein